MATKNIQIVQSDLSGKEEASTVTFGLGDTWYEIDLTEAEAKELERALSVYQDAGRRLGFSPVKPRKVVPKTTFEQRKRVRDWAKENGFELAEHGRITKAVFEAWNKAHPNEKFEV